MSVQVVLSCQPLSRVRVVLVNRYSTPLGSEAALARIVIEVIPPATGGRSNVIGSGVGGEVSPEVPLRVKPSRPTWLPLAAAVVVVGPLMRMRRV